jgi:hypothetical protein
MYEENLKTVSAELEAMIILARDTDLDEVQQEELKHLLYVKRYLTEKVKQGVDYTNADFADLVIEED